MKADVTDVNQLLNMIRSTSLTNYIRLDGQTQKLQLINPAGLFMKYLMPTMPTTISWSKTAALEKGFYHGVVFDIPGAEVCINGEWTTFSDQNKDAILAQNPMNLEWRLNGDLLRQLGYGSNNPVKGCILVVDDQWNGLTIAQDISVEVKE